MGQDTAATQDTERPSWTFGVTLDHPLAIFCPHHAEHVKKKEQEAGGPAGEAVGSTASPASATPQTDMYANTPSDAPSTTVVASAVPPGSSQSPRVPETATDLAATPAESNKVPVLPSTRGCPVMNNKSITDDADATASPVNPSNNMLLQEKQRPAPDQTSPLPTDRRVSSIPKTSEHTPKHQPDTADYWQYPSQQMFFNAMKRKGHEPQEEEMSTIVGMHNAVNERTWSELLQWERQLHPETADAVRLKKFSGDATKISPKARLRSLFGSSLPFDRHDWVVVRGEGGEEVRYVIDFYQAEARGASPVAFHIDVRPAVDSVSSLMDRVRMSVRKLTGAAYSAATAARPQSLTAGAGGRAPLQRRESDRWSDVLKH
eukprot:m.44913 g.44913  ORF g.44913 m.44913 type:complete len:375 (-) comp6592_c0_seq1:260-1384(-)